MEKKFTPKIKSTALVTLFTLLFTLLLNSSFLFAQYCTPTHNSPASEHITRVVVDVVDNSSTGSVSIADYTAQIANIGLGCTNAIQVDIQNTWAGTVDLRVYIDWNDNDNFTDANEIAVIESATVAGGASHTFNSTISVPITASTGTIE